MYFLSKLRNQHCIILLSKLKEDFTSILSVFPQQAFFKVFPDLFKYITLYNIKVYDMMIFIQHIVQIFYHDKTS